MIGQELYQVNRFAGTPFMITEIPDMELLDEVCSAVQLPEYAPHVTRDSFDAGMKIFNWWDVTNPSIRRLMDEYIEPIMTSYLPLVADINQINELKFETFVNIFTQGKVIGHHNHDFALAVSCVYLTDVTDGDIRLFTPLQHAQHGWREISDTGKPRNSFAYHPKKGSMILFPSWVAHEVEWYSPEQTRINICTNLGAL